MYVNINKHSNDKHMGLDAIFVCPYLGMPANAIEIPLAKRSV